MAKTKYITPFSNGTEAMQWEANNCDICKRAGCYEKKALQLAWATNKITRKVAETIGINKNRLKNRCDNFNVPIPRKVKIKENTHPRLF